jgi:hypothetical protein
MSTRLTKPETDSSSIPTGYEGNNIPDDFSVPSCTVEDVDRALFNLFDKDIPFFYKSKKEIKRIPVIFATGERFAVLRRKRPLRDNSGALILPLVSIMRSGIEQDVARGMGPGQGAPMVVKKRLSKDDPRYQALKNSKGMVNQDNLPSPLHRIGNTPDRDPTAPPPTGAVPGTVATRRGGHSRPLSAREGRLLAPSLGDNIFEVITLPPVKFFSATYEVTFWAQYTQQMNDMIMTIMTTYQNNFGKHFRIETDKGYWFVAYVGASFASGHNYDDFTDNERLVRYSFEVQVPAYIIEPDYPGSKTGLRSFVSAPQVNFETTQAGGAPTAVAPGGPPSSDPSAYILQDMTDVKTPLPGQGIGASPAASAIAAVTRAAVPGASVASSGPDSISTTDGGDSESVSSSPSTAAGFSGDTGSANLGGFASKETGIQFVRLERDPFTGKEVKKLVKIKTQNQKKGETVYREAIEKDLGDLC